MQRCFLFKENDRLVVVTYLLAAIDLNCVTYASPEWDSSQLDVAILAELVILWITWARSEFIETHRDSQRMASVSLRTHNITKLCAKCILLRPEKKIERCLAHHIQWVNLIFFGKIKKYFAHKAAVQSKQVPEWLLGPNSTVRNTFSSLVTAHLCSVCRW